MQPKITQRQIDPKLGQFSDSISPLLQRIYLGRGITHDEQLERTLAKLPRPDALRGLSDGVALLEEALTQQQSVLIVGDFDADGATSTVLTLLAMRAMGLQHIDFIVPNRFEFGYGLTPEIVALAQQRNPDLIITVDNG
ncbi:MAG: DHH family phosphoesterase, partial [Photobacterium frigidiphilum]|uniref:DHH family phosphoesterase n=1 Tax=Photobacterium frigidiphilum TaxID=264736 RepID=UPI0030015578